MNRPIDPLVGRLVGGLAGFAVWYFFFARFLSDFTFLLLTGTAVALPIFGFIAGGEIELWLRSRRR